IRYIIEVTNIGNVVANDLVVIDRRDTGLLYGQLPNPMQNVLGMIRPGESKQVAIPFRVAQAGKLCHTVEVTGPGGIHESKTAWVTAVGEPVPEPPAIKLTITSQQQLYAVGNTALFTIDITNTGTVPAQQSKVVVNFEQEFRVDQA